MNLNGLKEKTLEVRSSYDYDKFGFYPGNRKPTHVERIKDSIQEKDLTQFVPILVTKDNGLLMIIDGQNRYFACKELGKPIYYIEAKGLLESDMIVLNTNQKNWSLSDYVDFYCNQRDINYLR